MSLANVTIQINMLQATCHKCKKKFDYGNVDIFMIRGRSICVCRECCNKIIEFVDKED